MIPKPVLGLDVRRLPIGPAEGFVLSRVDGRATDSEIAIVTGMSPAEVIIVLHRLAELGAVAYEGSGNAPRQSPASPNGTTTTSGLHRRVEPVITDRPIAEPSVDDAPELAEAIDLDLDRKKLILKTFRGLEKQDHYRVLNVGYDAEKKAIKSAYFAVVANFHPDRYFGKNLGTYKQKLESIFKRITEAHDTLTRKEPRAEYDKYLENQRATQALEEIVDEEAHSRQLDEVQREIEREAAQAEAPPVSPARPAPTPDERRRALARKFSSPNLTQARRSGPAPAEGAGHDAQETARQLLLGRYDAKLAEVRAERVKRLVDQASQALSSKNLLSAANALRLAVSLAPDDKALAERFAVVERDAAATLAERYLEQARYDEQRSHWAEAAQAYERVLKGRPTAQTYERAAHCLVEARLELKKAVELGRKAVELAPKSTANRITLARAFARAGMSQSALAELERARTQDPGNESVKEWINRVKRGEV